MVSRRNRTLLSLAIFTGVLAWNVAAAAIKGETGIPVENLTTHEIEEQLQVLWRHSFTFPCAFNFPECRVPDTRGCDIAQLATLKTQHTLMSRVHYGANTHHVGMSPSTGP